MAPRKSKGNLSSTCLLAALASAGVLCAQPPAWNATKSGYVFDRVTPGIRPLLGIIGSAYAGAPVLTGVDWASITPDGRSALVSQDGSLWWVPNPSGSDRIAIDVVGAQERSGSVYIADAGAGREVLLELDGRAEAQPVLKIEAPSGLALAGDEALFVADSATRSIRVYDLASRSLTIALAPIDSPGASVPPRSSRLLVNRRTLPSDPFLFLDYLWRAEKCFSFRWGNKR